MSRSTTHILQMIQKVDSHCVPTHPKKKRLTATMEPFDLPPERNLEVCLLSTPFLDIVCDIYINISAYIQFRLGHSSTSGIACKFKPLNHPHVLRVTLTRGVWTNIFLKLVSLLPLTIQRIARTIWPAYFLPDVIVVKKLKPD